MARQSSLLLKLTDFPGGNYVEGLTMVAGEAILHGARTSALLSRLPAGAGGSPHVPHHTRSRRPGQLLSILGTVLSVEPLQLLPLTGHDPGLYVGSAQCRQPVSVSGGPIPPDAC